MTLDAFVARTLRGERLADIIAADPAGTLLACDFDGTLAHIVPNPADARMVPSSRAALGRLADLVGHVAIVTGREVRTVVALGELAELFGGRDNVVALGQYGVERWDAATGEVSEPPAPEEVREAIAAITAELDRRAEGHGLGGDDLVGTSLEDKGRAVGVHFRRAANAAGAQEALEPFLAQLAERLGLVCEPGRNVIELRSSARTKGEALAELAEEVGARVVVMCGDDLGDLTAFRVAQSWPEGGAVASGNPEQPTVVEASDIACDGPDGVAAWLTTLADRLTDVR